ncbi:hypothetical protein, partial [Ensifer aridi]|uniref:hypothetical protein n=1 Tax=Ensifer aridi TaxID=1708715 RepID=UPI001AEC97C4
SSSGDGILMLLAILRDDSAETASWSTSDHITIDTWFLSIVKPGEKERPGDGNVVGFRFRLYYFALLIHMVNHG